MHISRYTRTIPYLVIYKWNNSFKIELEDKVIIRTKDNRLYTGYVHNIGTKYLFLRTSGKTYIAKSEMQGRCCWWSSQEIVIKDIDQIAKYPKDSQDFTNTYLGRR